jgi:hypothetical protein
MCPDIVETKLLNQREREWRPDPQVINKWTVLYNLQKDDMSRIQPQIQAMKGYDDIMHQKIIKEKAEKQNLANLIQFQNKVNGDLKKGDQDYKFDSEENCDDEAKFKHNQVVGPVKPNLTDFNKLLVSEMRNNRKDLHDVSKSNLDPANKSMLMNSIKNFFTNKNGFNFKEQESDIKNNSEDSLKDKIPEANFVNENMMNININDDAIKSSVDFDKIISGIKLKKGEKIEYLGTSVGSPYANFDQSKVNEKLTKINEEVGKPVISKVNFMNGNENKSEIKKTEPKLNNNIKSNIHKNKETKKTDVEPILLQKSEISETSKTLHKNKFETNSDAVLDTSDSISEENNKILNPPQFSSFVESTETVSLEKNVLSNLDSKSNFNMETQRRGRRRSRFPDPQWDCAEAQIAKLVRYLCEEEMSSAYQKYCKPIFEQINTMIESFLYHDNHLEICQNIHMCPVTVDI